MNSLTKYTNLLKRFPSFELSYETVSHKKVSSSDSIALAISLGRKYFIWYTYRDGTAEDICYLVGLDKDKQICSVEQRKCTSPVRFCLGTVVYCTMYEVPDSSVKILITEDIYYYRGMNISKLCFGDRIQFLVEFVQKSDSMDISLPVMWYVNSIKEKSHIIPSNIASKIAYNTHHIQYRDVRQVSPYINVIIPKRGTIHSNIAVPVSSATVAQKMTAASNPLKTASNMEPQAIPKFDFTKPTYRYPAVFHIMADSQLDLYHLYAYGGVGVSVYCGLAGVQSLKTSVFMNKLFRRIRENDNLDLAEESEDESDFENTDMNKFVDLDKILPIECMFNQKHKKWIPVRLVGKHERVIHIEKLVLGGMRRY